MAIELEELAGLRDLGAVDWDALLDKATKAAKGLQKETASKAQEISKTVIWGVAGVVGIGVLGVILYLKYRK